MQLREKLSGLQRGLTASSDEKEEARAPSAPLYICSCLACARFMRDREARLLLWFWMLLKI